MDSDDRIERWFQQYGNDIYNYIAYFTGRRDVEDLVQDVFTKALRALSGYEGRSQPKTWLLTIARHTAIDSMRKQKWMDWFPGIGWGKISFLEGIQRSSNVAFAILGYERLKQDLLQDYLERFGFGQKTEIDIGNEESGQIPDMDEPSQAALAAMGDGGSASAIQQVAAVGAIANGGELLKPHIRKMAGTDPTNTYEVRQVISEETAKRVRDILESVVSSQYGSGKAFFMDDCRVAGKSSVSQKLDQQGKVMDGKYIVTFIGFAPSDKPRLLLYVAVDEPKAELPAALGWKEVVAPPFKEIMEKSLQYVRR